MYTNNKEPNIKTKGEYAKYLYEGIEHIIPEYFPTMSQLIEDSDDDLYEPYLHFMKNLTNEHQLVQYKIFGNGGK